MELDERRCVAMTAALGFAQHDAPELQLLHRWLDSWRGIGDIVVGSTHPLSMYTNCPSQTW